MMDFLIIGGGLFGSVIARVLERAGADVEIVDDGRALAGSGPAACLMKPSWFNSSLTRVELESSLHLLDEHYGLSELSFTLDPTRGQVKIYWVNPRAVLGWGAHLRTRARVETLGDSERGWHAVLSDGSERRARRAVLCTGVWANELGGCVPGLEPRMGAAFLWQGVASDPHIYPGIPNPYRQLLRFDRGDGTWASDGHGVKLISDHGIAASLKRCSEHTRLPAHKAQVLVGTRPYVRDAKPCYLRQERPGLWVATGGAKNGTVAAAWCAARLAREYAR